MDQNGANPDDLRRHETMYQVFNAFSLVAVVYLGSLTSLNRWRAVLKYDEAVTSPDSPLAFELQPSTQTPLSKDMQTFIISACALIAFYAGWCGYIAFTQDFAYGLDQFVMLILTLSLSVGFSTVLRVREIEGVMRIQNKTGWLPHFKTMSIPKNEARMYFMASGALGLYTAIEPNRWLVSVATCGIVFRLVSDPYGNPINPDKTTSVRGVTAILLAYVLSIVTLLGVVLAGIAYFSSESSDSSSLNKPFYTGKHASPWSTVLMHYHSAYSATFSALVLRAEWAAAQEVSETRIGAIWAEKQTLLEKVGYGAEIESNTFALATPGSPPATKTESPFLTAFAGETQPASDPPKLQAIRVPPVDPFHLIKDGKSVGRLEPFSSPIFHMLLLTTFFCNITPTLLTRVIPVENLKWVLVSVVPGQGWALLFNPLVLGCVVLVRWNRGGKQIWRYSEKWVKDVARAEKIPRLAEEPGTRPPTQVDVE